MKPGSNNKIRLLALLLAASVACAGYIFYTPKLINADKPFIDLSGSIGTAIGNANEAYENEQEQSAEITPTPSPTKAPTPTPMPTKTPSDEPVYNMVVSVAGTVIVINSSRCVDINDFATRIAKYQGRVKVIDDYAELKTFRKVLKTLTELDNDYIVETVY